jgi:hypothetical protein
MCLPQCSINLFGIEADNHRAINHDYGGGHVSKLLQFLQSLRILGDVFVVEWDTLLRKVLFRLAAEHSTRLPKIGMSRGLTTRVHRVYGIS